MKRIVEFETKLIEKINLLENSKEVTVEDFEKRLTSDGTIHYSYTSSRLDCKIETAYKGFRDYGNDRMLIKLTILFES